MPYKKGISPSFLFFVELMNIYKFNKVFALGRDASNELNYLGVKHSIVRHPSYGGQTEFRNTILLSSGVSTEERTKKL